MNSHCPFAGQVIICSLPTCRGCEVFLAAMQNPDQRFNKLREALDIADNMKSYWANQNSGAA